MTHLFWRIFLSFWLVIIMALAMTVAANSIVLRARMDNMEVQSLRASMDALTEPAERALATHGVAGLRSWLQGQIQEHPTRPLFIVGPDNHDLLDRRVPPWSPYYFDWLRRMDGDPHAMPPPERPSGFGPGGGPRVPARVIVSPEGERFLLFVPLREMGLRRWLLEPQAEEISLIITILVSGVTCFFLARHMTRPILALRHAGQLIAQGDLSARVGMLAGRRRDEFGALARDFDRMAERIQLLIASREQLLRDVSHELRSPLARLQVAIGLIRQKAEGVLLLPLDRIEREADRLNALIGQVLSFARLETARGTEPRRVDLIGMLQAICDDARFEGSPTGREILLRGDAPLVMEGDEGLLRSAIENVVRNAVEHARHRVVVTLATTPGDAALSLTVQDDGPGVGEEDLPRLFEPFFTGQRPEQRTRGSGLGLAIARRAVDLHGGSIEASNGPDGGLQVRLTIPSHGFHSAPRVPSLV